MTLLSFLTLGGVPPAAPFPDLGPNPPDHSLSCDSYGAASSLADDQAQIAVVDAVAAGGAEYEAAISIKISNARSLAGFTGKIEWAGSFIQGTIDRESEMNPLIIDPFFLVSRLAGDDLVFGILGGAYSPKNHFFPPGTDTLALRLLVCLQPGTPAGVYPLTLGTGEMVDNKTGLSIQPQLASGSLTVQEDVLMHQGCSPIKPPPDDDEEKPATVFYRLGDGTAVPGGDATIPFTIHSDKAVQGFSYSIDFDESILQGNSVERVFQNFDGSDYFFEVYYIDNTNLDPDHGIQEGSVAGAMVPGLYPAYVLPVNQDVLVYRFHFHVHPDAPAGTTELPFIDGGRSQGRAVKNGATVGGKTLLPNFGASFIFISGNLRISVDGVPFFRGELNDDHQADLTDCMLILQHLFIGNVQIGCQSAADVNGDGDIDITDPIYLLRYLYLGEAAPPDPFNACAKDGGGRHLSCVSFKSCKAE